MAPTPRATVIVCVRNDWRVLRLLASLERQSLALDEFEVIIVWTGVEDYRPILGRLRLDVTAIFSPVARLPVQRNIGLGLARGDVYLTTDADCVAGPTWIESMMRTFDAAGSDVVAVGGTIEKHSRSGIVQQFGITIDDGQRTLNYLPALDLPYVTGANSAYRTEAVRSIGGYDEQFSCGDDVDVSYRLGIGGGRLTLAPDALIRHEDRSTLVEHFRRFSWYAEDQALLFKKFQRHSGRSWNVNDYPWRRLGTAAASFGRGLGPAIRGDWSGPAEGLVTAAEAAGVIVGGLRGAARHRVAYF